MESVRAIRAAWRSRSKRSTSGRRNNQLSKASRIAGARSYRLGPGDVLWIPPDTPHQTLVPKGGEIRYLAFKFPAKP